MKNYKSNQLRNLAIIAHGGTGKTSLAEAMLYLSGGIDRFCRVDDGASTMDYDADEIKRKISISASVAPVEWKDCKINLIDTPGYADFVGEVIGALSVADMAVILADAVGGVEVGTELTWGYADERNLPRMVVVSRMDRENSDFQKVVTALKETFGNAVAPIQLPIGTADNFTGVIDLIKMKAYTWTDATGKNFKEGPIPSEYEGKANEYREALMEFAAESDEDLLTKFFEGEELTQEEFERGIAMGIATNTFYPVTCCSSSKLIGIQTLLDAIALYAPSPVTANKTKVTNVSSGEEIELAADSSAAMTAMVFKTLADPYVGKVTLFRVYSGVFNSDSTVYNATKDKTERIGQVFFLKGKQQIPTSEVVAGDIAGVAKLAETTTGDTFCDKDNAIMFPAINFHEPVLSLAMKPKAKGDEEKIGSGLARLQEEDPTIRYMKDAETNELVVSGMGEMHVEVISDRLKRKFGVEVTLDTPIIAYRETIKGTVKVEGKHKKQSGGRGQYGHVWIEFSPLPTGSGFEFEDKVFGGAVPRQFIPAVEKGLREAIPDGLLAGYPLVDFKASLYDGSSHAVDSSEMAFKIAAQLAIKKAWEEANAVLLEPIVKAEVRVPEQYMGDVIGDFNKKRGRILGMDPAGKFQIINALVPASEMFKYSIDLRSMTGGRGTFKTEFDHYEEVPAQIAQQIIENSPKNKQS